MDELRELVEKWRATANGIMPDSMDYTVSRGVWHQCANEIENYIKAHENEQDG